MSGLHAFIHQAPQASTPLAQGQQALRPYRARASSPRICSLAIQPCTFIRSNQLPSTSRLMAASQRLHRWGGAGCEARFACAQEQAGQSKPCGQLVGIACLPHPPCPHLTSSWWKPSSHKKPRGKKLRLGTAAGRAGEGRGGGQCNRGNERAKRALSINTAAQPSKTKQACSPQCAPTTKPPSSSSGPHPSRARCPRAGRCAPPPPDPSSPAA